MKYCVHCGAQIIDEAVVCVHCGRFVNEGISPSSKNGKETNVMCLLGFIFSFFVPIIGLILSIIGYNQTKTSTEISSKNFAKAGIIISSIAIGLIVILIAIWIICLGVFISGGYFYYY